ncbi:hypothetical protein N3K66_002465 [Trichothecium roseum]|uniref:Uncharacterized protein n=1 Tax=Trichothecium roseum TaxID=47278 RepID=A0ACC0VCC9_9HYPO|nr:hypothetical protein N3K66_002465 [Trichothecium roseum]
MSTITLITGANSGIGFELARQLITTEANHVLLGCRSEEKGEKAARELRSMGLPGTVEPLLIDVVDEASVIAAVQKVESTHGRLDALVNNAGIWVPQEGSLHEQLTQILNVNTIAPAVVTELFAPLLRKSSGTPRIIHVSSGGGSIGARLIPGGLGYDMSIVPYRISKAGLNMLAACNHVELGREGFKTFLYSPGPTVSNLSKMNTAKMGMRAVDLSTAPMVDMLAGRRDEDAGKNLHFDKGVHGEHPW